MEAGDPIVGRSPHQDGVLSSSSPSANLAGEFESHLSTGEKELPVTSRTAAGHGQGRRRDHCRALFHLLLARGRHRSERSRLVHVLRRRHRRTRHRRKRPLVHPRRHAVQLRGALRLHGKLQHVRARRRVRRGARRHGSVRGAPFGFRADFRLHPDRARSAWSAPGQYLGAPAERVRRA